MSARERVFIVDDEAPVRRGLTRLLRAAGLEATAFESPEAFLHELPADATGCVILDLSMPRLDGLALQRELASRGCSLPIVFLTGRADVPQSVQAMKGGAADFLTKPVDDEVLLSAIRQALDADRSGREARSETDAVRHRLAALTTREREVLAGVVDGKLNKQIGGELGITEKTVKVHRGRVMEKMAAGSVAELVHLAARAGVRRA
ncbi:MAG TPA: response regulator [Thermoanaerobaculia bacterium]